MITIVVGGYRRITKARARRAFNAGWDIHIVSKNLAPNNAWQPAIKVNKADGEIDFDKVINTYTYYNGEPWFYIKADNK